MDSSLDIVRANIVERLERNARIAQTASRCCASLNALDTQMFFNALADAGDFNRKHPERRIPPLDPVLCKVQEPRLLTGASADTNAADRWRTA